jgi:hypothetical protein
MCWRPFHWPIVRAVEVKANTFGAIETFKVAAYNSDTGTPCRAKKGSCIAIVPRAKGLSLDIPDATCSPGVITPRHILRLTSLCIKLALTHNIALTYFIIILFFVTDAIKTTFLLHTERVMVLLTLNTHSRLLCYRYRTGRLIYLIRERKDSSRRRAWTNTALKR